jgi:hypothetical protein
MDRNSVLTADGVRTVANPGKPSLTIPTTPIRSVAEAVAQEHKRADDSLAHRLAINVLGLTDDPLKATIEKVVTSRVDIQGKLTKGPGSI